MRRFRFIPLLAAVLVAGQAAAAPFCVQVEGLPLQCLFVDPGQCRQEADRQGGICAANPAEFTTPAGGMPFCTVESGNVSTCMYPDRASCDTEGRQRGGACIEAVPAKPPIQPNPYQIRLPY